jgi:hypothetical protein
LLQEKKVAEIFYEIIRLKLTTKQIVQVIHKLHVVKEPKKPNKTQKALDEELILDT